MAIFTKESVDEKNNTLYMIMIIVVLIGTMHTIITSDTGNLKSILISLILLLVCATLTTVGMK